MSGFIVTQNQKYPPYYIDISFIQNKIQESLDNGVDDDEESIKELLRYYTEGVQQIEVRYMRSCNFYVIKMKTVNDKTGQEYHYKFFVHSYR